MNTILPAKIPQSHVCKLVRSSVEKGRWRLSAHAQERMEERGFILTDVRRVLLNGKYVASLDRFSDEHGEWAYAIRGKTVDRVELRIPVALKPDGTVVITVIDDSE